MNKKDEMEKDVADMISAVRGKSDALVKVEPLVDDTMKKLITLSTRQIPLWRYLFLPYMIAFMTGAWTFSASGSWTSVALSFGLMTLLFVPLAIHEEREGRRRSRLQAEAETKRWEYVRRALLSSHESLVLAQQLVEEAEHPDFPYRVREAREAVEKAQAAL